MPQIYNVEKDFLNTRLDKWFKLKVVDLPQSLIEKIIRLNKIKINNKKTKSSYRLQINDVVKIFDISKFKPNKKLNIVKYKPSNKEANSYEKYILENNNNFIVINKPSGVPVQSGTKSFKNIIDILKDTELFKGHKPYIVHRLDKETSGVLIIAKNREYAQLFTSLFRIRKIHKTYLAIVHGKISKDLKILKDELVYYESKKKIVQKAISYIKILKISDNYSLLELNPITGRKHQLRKQLYNIGCPIVGDNKYFIQNIKKKQNQNLKLHAFKLKFMIKNVKYSFKVNYNSDFDSFLKKYFKSF